LLGLALTQTLTPVSQRRFAPWPASYPPSLVAHHCLNQSLAKHNRKPSQVVENKHQRPKSIASFCRVLACATRLTNHDSRSEQFLTATDRIQTICNPMKTEEKRFSNRNKTALRGTCNQSCLCHVALLVSATASGRNRAVLAIS